ncbi:MAG: ATP-binding protein [Thermodesulfobacteriota bacterium]
MSNDSTQTQDNSHEVQIAHLTILPEERYLSAIVDVVSDLANANGISKKDTTHLDKILVEIFNNIVKYGFQEDISKSIEISIFKRLHTFVISLEDKGLPFDYENLELGEDKRFKSYLSRGYADQVNFYCLGTLGNKTEIVKNLPASDIRDEMDISEHRKHLEIEPVGPGAEIKIDHFQPDKVHELVRLVYKCYGYTYANEFMYYPEQIESRLHSKLMSSCGAYNKNNELVGHLAFIFSNPNATVGESGEAVVDPRYRGNGIFPKMKSFLTNHAVEQELIGVYGEAVTIHPYSQKGSLELGSTETGFLLGYSPGTVSFQNISEDEKPRRQSIALMFTPVTKSKPAKIYVPEKYLEIIKTIYDRMGYERELVTENRESVYPHTNPGHVSVNIRSDHNQGIITVSKFGNNTLNEIRFHLKQLCLQRTDCIYVDLPLNQSGSGYKASKLRELGFFYGYLIPEYSDSDVLRLQYLNNVEISRDDIKTASDFGEELLGFIIKDWSNEDI